MIHSSLRFARLRTSVSSVERLDHSGGDQLGIALVAILPLCKCLRAQKSWDLIFPYSRIRAKHVEVVTLSSSRRSTAFVQPSFCIGCATQKLLIRFRTSSLCQKYSFKDKHKQCYSCFQPNCANGRLSRYYPSTVIPSSCHGGGITLFPSIR
jgi:hypothetical protein